VGKSFRESLLALTRILCVIALLPIINTPLFACSCVPERPVCEAYQSADAVFLGEVPWRPMNLLSLLLGTTASLRVIEVFKGELGEEVTLQMNFAFPGGCSYSFRVGERYLVYAYQRDGHFGTSICSRTRPIQKAEDDLDFLRRAKDGLAQGKIFGLVTREHTDYYSPNPTQPVAGALVGLQPLAEDSKLVCRAADDKGHYEFSNLPPGKYELFADRKLRAYPESEREKRIYQVTLSKGGCARVVWTVQAPAPQ